MGAAAKKDRRREKQRRTGYRSELEVAGLAQGLWDQIWSEVGDQYVGHVARRKAELLGRPPRAIKIDLGYVFAAREWVNRNWRGPSYVWMPASFLATKVCLDAEIPMDDGPVVASETVGAVMHLVTLAAWRHAPLIARFDADLAEALMETPLSMLPADLLRHLPAPALFIPMPWLAPNTGVFVAINHSLNDDGTTDDELVLIISTLNTLDDGSVDADTMLIPISLSVRSIEDAFGETVGSDDQLIPLANRAGMDELVQRRFGRGLVQLCSEIANLLLYLTSKEPDLQRTRLDRDITPRAVSSESTVAMDVTDVGVRLGAQLRESRAETSSRSAVESNGRTVRPHGRVAHWNTYWTGPRDSPERRLVPHWIPFMIVGKAKTDGEQPIVVRDVAPPD
jgi:hypothetical protein